MYTHNGEKNRQINLGYATEALESILPYAESNFLHMFTYCEQISHGVEWSAVRNTHLLFRSTFPSRTIHRFTVFFYGPFYLSMAVPQGTWQTSCLTEEGVAVIQRVTHLYAHKNTLQVKLLQCYCYFPKAITLSNLASSWCGLYCTVLPKDNRECVLMRTTIMEYVSL